MTLDEVEWDPPVFDTRSANLKLHGEPIYVVYWPDAGTYSAYHGHYSLSDQRLLHQVDEFEFALFLLDCTPRPLPQE
jgi:hypothetical protein